MKNNLEENIGFLDKIRRSKLFKPISYLTSSKLFKPISYLTSLACGLGLTYMVGCSDINKREETKKETKELTKEEQVMIDKYTIRKGDTIWGLVYNGWKLNDKFRITHMFYQELIRMHREKYPDRTLGKDGTPVLWEGDVIEIPEGVSWYRTGGENKGYCMLMRITNPLSCKLHGASCPGDERIREVVPQSGKYQYSLGVYGISLKKNLEGEISCVLQNFPIGSSEYRDTTDASYNLIN